MRRLIGRYSGIVQEVFEVVTSEREPGFFAYGARTCDTRRFAVEQAIRQSGGGGRTREEALTRCLGEAAERYAAALYDKSSLLWAEAPPGAILPADIYPFSDSQKADPEFPFAKGGPNRWKLGIDLRTGGPRYAPAFCVYIPYTPTEGEALYAPTMSTGLAAGPNLQWALRSALFEVIERDTFTNWWASEGEAGLVDGVVYLPNDLGVPVAAKLTESDVLSVGASAGSTWADAAEHATLEALLGQSYVRALVRRSPGKKQAIDFGDHARYYMDHAEHREKLREMFSPKEIAEPSGPAVDPVEALLSAGFDPWYCDITPVDLASLGLVVVRALVPGMTPLHSWDRWPFLGAKRIGSVKNLLPHPLP